MKTAPLQDRKVKEAKSPIRQEKAKHTYAFSTLQEYFVETRKFHFSKLLFNIFRFLETCF